MHTHTYKAVSADDAKRFLTGDITRTELIFPTLNSMETEAIHKKASLSYERPQEG